MTNFQILVVKSSNIRNGRIMLNVSVITLNQIENTLDIIKCR